MYTLLFFIYATMTLLMLGFSFMKPATATIEPRNYIFHLVINVILLYLYTTTPVEPKLAHSVLVWVTSYFVFRNLYSVTHGKSMTYTVDTWDKVKAVFLSLLLSVPLAFIYFN